MIVAEGLSCARGARIVLGGVDLVLRPGEVLGVLGANGAGKSSLLATLAGELAPAGGRLLLDGRAMGEATPKALARRRAVLSQSPGLAFDLDVEVVVGMGAYPFPELAPGAVAGLVERALALADVASLRGRRCMALSGGEQQRVHFARVLVQVLAALRVQAPGQGAALLLDEPTASLDPLHQVLLLRAVAGLVRDEPLAALVVLHDVNLAALWCDRVLLLARGRPVASGLPREVLNPGSLLEVYGLPARVGTHPDRPDRALVTFGLP